MLSVVGRARRARGLLVTVTAVAAVAVPGAHAGGRCGDAAARPWCDTSHTPDERAGLLVAALTQDEKVALLAGDDLVGVAGQQGTHTGTSTGVPRVGLPTVFYSDGPVGVRSGVATALPTPMSVGASFDTAVAARQARVIADEAKAKGNDVVYAPTINLLRTPLWGRTFETFGEDPELLGQMGTAWIRAAQDRGIIANVKHYAANNQEGQGAGDAAQFPGVPLGGAVPGVQGNRLTVDVRVDERTLRETYLPHFEAAVKEGGVGSVMCSYNRLNGQYACENEQLLSRILRREWGFKGYVLADYGAAKNPITSLNNGLDFDPWPGIAYQPALVAPVLAAGQVSSKTLDDAIRRQLRTLFAFGFFDRDAYPEGEVDAEAGAREAAAIGEAGITLLRNEGDVLPLKPGTRLAVIGRPADRFVTGGGSANVAPTRTTTPLAALRARGPVTYDDGTDLARAAATAKAADVAVVVAGDYVTEFVDRRCLSLQCPPIYGDQDALVEAVAAANPRTVVVLQTAGPVLTPWREKVAGLVEAWYAGQEAGTAIARVLYGDVDATGRLPATFPASEDETPVGGDVEAYPGVAETVRFKEGVLVGYRWWDARGRTPAFPFGFGLSYTTWKHTGLRVTPVRDGATVSVVVRNTGRRAGSDVAQLYLEMPDPRPGVAQPPRQLRDFAKVALGPGAARRVTLRLDERAFSYWDTAADGWRVAPGCYGVVVGRSSRDVQQRATVAVGTADCPGAAVRVLGASPRVCTSRRTVTITLPRGIRRRGVRRVVVTVAGRRVRTLRGGRTRVRVSFRGRRSGRATVVLRVTGRDGRVRTVRRVYRLCVPRGA